ncbi:Similar to SPOPL: Speckle-type POZ protein-like (Homo sapiens) [Cotesia congregata]|uniref:Similar to SPOPL: Speckle-type POZ protein-like (Homo sapiens) n=1 Tax=Cotesia congregata TaxID=51543 RepID=A0A8J2HFL6_COTCN|nr:Similar to SPOPL: Speckle-type POZ protein-like (Homo sapiens) [Cotesia congregata]
MSEEAEVNQNEKINYECTLEIQEENKWTNSDFFSIQQGLDFKFNISARKNEKYRLDIKVTKFSTKSAIAIIELKIDNMIPIRKDVTNWTDDVIFEDLVIPSNCHACQYHWTLDECNKTSKGYHVYKIPITCSIVWHAFNDGTLCAKLYKNMEAYFENSEFSDVKIRAKNNEEFSAHKIILSSNSSVFQQMLTTDMKEKKENCINLPELDADIIKELLFFLYHGKLDKAGDNSATLLELVKVADMYCISELKRICDLSLSNNLSLDNVMSLFEVSKAYKLVILKERALIYIANNVNSLRSQEMLVSSKKSLP